MAEVRRVDGARAAHALADLLNGNTRTTPVVVVTIPASRTEPWIDAEEIAGEAGDLAEVYLMPTGSFTWEFSHRMAEGTQVYGGAGRVYPVGHAWVEDLSRSPLRFAFDARDGERATRQLVSDMLRMVASAGLLQRAPTVRPVDASGVVRSIVAGRALVDIGRTLAAIAEELTVEGVPIERIVSPGQRVEGLLDPVSKRLDIRRGLRAGAEALAGYEVGQVVLGRVADVEAGRAEVVLYPQTSTPPVRVRVAQAEVSSNPADDLRTLMTPGEVVAARVAGTSPWALVLHDVDDDEPIAPAPSLLAGGPPWLVEEPEHVEPHEVEAVPVPPAPPATPVPAAEAEPEPAAGIAPAPATEPVRPTPAMFDRNRRPAPVPAPPVPAQPVPAEPVPSGPVPSGTGSTRTLLLKVDGLNAEVAALKREMAALRMQLLDEAQEREQLDFLRRQAEARANRAENDLKSARSRLRKAGGGRPAQRSAQQAVEGPRFADAEEGFRYLVQTQWATRTAPGEQGERPLRPYLIGPGFLDSLARLEGIKVEKVADVAFEIVTGLAAQLPGREVHRLRTGTGGDDPVRIRADGAVAWRASLQVNTPSARRLHYWVLPTGEVELARVSTHDDFEA